MAWTTEEIQGILKSHYNKYISTTNNENKKKLRTEIIKELHQLQKERKGANKTPFSLPEDKDILHKVSTILILLLFILYILTMSRKLPIGSRMSDNPNRTRKRLEVILRSWKVMLRRIMVLEKEMICGGNDGHGEQRQDIYSREKWRKKWKI
jgi:hypothetical protein